jgi:hypothetical protein
MELWDVLLARFYKQVAPNGACNRIPRRIRFDDAGQQAQIADFGAPFSAPANL